MPALLGRLLYTPVFPLVSPYFTKINGNGSKTDEVVPLRLRRAHSMSRVICFLALFEAPIGLISRRSPLIVERGSPTSVYNGSVTRWEWVSAFHPGPRCPG
jgi:hypothetical protein